MVILPIHRNGNVVTTWIDRSRSPPVQTWYHLSAIVLVILLLLATGPAAAKADTVTLKNGDTLTGQVVLRNAKTLVFKHPVLGTLHLAIAQIKAVHIELKKPAQKARPHRPASKPTSQPKPSSAATAISHAAAANAPKLPSSEGGFFDKPFFKGWDNEFSLGLAGSQSNTKTRSFNAEFKTKKQTTKVRWLFDSKYFYSSDHSQTTENQFDAQLTHDWLLPKSPWFYFARGRYDYDQFQDWKARVSAYAGGGYTFVDNPDLQVLGRLGGGATKNLGGDYSLTPEALIGASVIKWKLTKKQTLSLSETLYPAMNNLGRFRNLLNASWTVKIDEAKGLSLKLGLQDQYDSHVIGYDKRNNLKYYGAIVLDF